jgi:CRP/FNR family cyclic AMP-dependent transcriptional regulator
MLRRDAKIELIAEVPLFAKCSKREMAKIASVADELDIYAGKVLIREGQRGSEFFVLIDGNVDVTARGKWVRTLRSGEFFGEIALISDVPRTATVTASTPLHVLVITRRSFMRLLEESPQIQQKVLRTLADRVSELVGLGVY